MISLLDKYNVSSGTSLVDCGAEPNEVRPLDKANCQFDIEEALGECGEWPFGYVVDRMNTNYAQPCIILKLNKVTENIHKYRVFFPSHCHPYLAYIL